MAKNNAELIDEVVNYTEKKVIELEHREKINVAMRIDETLDILSRILGLAKDDQSSRKFDLTLDKTGNCTVAYTVNGESASAGANVLKYGDTLVITVTAGTGSTIKKLKVNGKNYTSGTAITVDTDIAVEVVATLNTYDLTVTPAEHTTITVTKGGVAVVPGEDAISYGDELRISASADEGYQITALTINDVDYVGDQTVTVSGNVTVTTTATTVGE